MVESRCGIICSQCRFTECKGCVKIMNPFWGKCDVKTCCEEKKLTNCGACKEFPCKVLEAFAYDGHEGDNGRRIEQCRIWGARLVR